jgi:hypothetical protein
MIERFEVLARLYDMLRFPVHQTRRERRQESPHKPYGSYLGKLMHSWLRPL